MDPVLDLDMDPAVRSVDISESFFFTFKSVSLRLRVADPVVDLDMGRFGIQM